MAADYACTISLLDGTDSIRSVPGIVRELKYDMDIIIRNDVSYLRQLLAWLLDNLKTLHQELNSTIRNSMTICFYNQLYVVIKPIHET